MVQKTYKWTKSYSIDAQIVGEYLEKLPDRSDEAVVAAARNKNSPIHSIFEWDNSIAGHEYRLIQSRVMRASLRTEIVSITGKREEVMAFIASSDRVHFVPIMEATVEEITASEQKCWQEMQSFKSRWKHLQMARAVIEAIAEVDRNLRRKRR